MRRLQRSRKGVVLLSGGLDSATTLYYALREGFTLHALSFDYGQRHRKELHAARKLVQQRRLPHEVITVSFPWIQSALTKRSVKVPLARDLSSKEIPSTYVSGRNIIFLSYAASYAESIHAQYIFIGAHIQDYSGYPDCRPAFLEAMEKALNKGVAGSKIRIAAPLLHRTKKEIVSLACSLEVPFEKTWSCYSGKTYPCGACDSCRYRAQAFRELRIPDPLNQRKGRKK